MRLSFLLFVASTLFVNDTLDLRSARETARLPERCLLQGNSVKRRRQLTRDLSFSLSPQFQCSYRSDYAQVKTGLSSIGFPAVEDPPAARWPGIASYCLANENDIGTGIVPVQGSWKTCPGFASACTTRSGKSSACVSPTKPVLQWTQRFWLAKRSPH